MNRWLLLVFLWTGCSAPPHPVEMSDVETTIESLLSRAQTGGSSASLAFISELSTEGFPLSEQSGTLAGPIRALRMVDGRLIVDLLARTGEQNYELTLWLENRGQDWLIAGWDPSMRRLSGTSVDTYGPTDVPVLFAAPSLRRAPKAITIPRMSTGTRLNTKSSPKHTWLKVRARIRDVGRDCPPRSRLTRDVSAVRNSVKRCHEQAFPQRTRGHGRVVLSMEKSQLKLMESTMISESFAGCLTKTIQPHLVSTPKCSYTIDLLLSTAR